MKAVSISLGTMGHPVAKGDSSEAVWLEMLQGYLPQRYQAAKAFVVDSEGIFSEQIDVVIFDRQYSPFIFVHQSQTIIPAESYYGVFKGRSRQSMPQLWTMPKRKSLVFDGCIALACPSRTLVAHIHPSR